MTSIMRAAISALITIASMTGSSGQTAACQSSVRARKRPIRGSSRASSTSTSRARLRRSRDGLRLLEGHIAPMTAWEPEFDSCEVMIS